MKKIFVYIAAIILILCFAVVPAVAADEGGERFDGGDVVTEVYETAEETEGPLETPVPTGTSDGEVITENMSETVADTKRETETETKTETETETKGIWALMKSEFGADPRFWTVVMLFVVMSVLVVFVCYVLLAKVNPTSRKSMNGMTKAVDIVRNIKEENSQTLAKIVEDNALFKEKVLELEEKLSRVESLDVKEKHDLFLALFNDLRIHKLVCDRLAMPVNDKSIIDLWYTQGMEAIKDDISEEDLAFINRISEKLNGVGKKK